ncbi:MAG: translocation/assembly module TamB domain-containing protein [Candidatus Electrothrix sp. YB6]
MKSGKTAAVFSFSLLRKCLSVLFLFALLGIAFVVALTTEPGFQLLLRTADRLSGSVFSVHQIEGHLLSRWRLEKVQVHLQDTVDVAADELRLSWSPEKLLEKRLVLHQVAAQGLTVRPASGREKEQEKDRPPVLPEIRLPFAIDIEDLQLRDGRIFSPGKAEPFVIREFVLRASARNTQQKTRVDIQRLKLDSPQYGADLQGQVAFHDAWPLSLQGTWRVADPGINDLKGSLKAAGDMNRLAVDLALAAPAEVTLQGQLTDILTDLHWQAKAKTGHFHLNDIKVDVPVDGALTIVEASGTTGSYQGTLAADIHYQGYPAVRAEAEVTAADYAGLTIHSLTVSHGASALTLRGMMHWQGGFSWQAELESREVDPSLVAAQWPGKISGLIRSRGKLTASGKELSVNIDQLRGELLGFPLTGSGGMELDKQGINLKTLKLQAGSARAEVDGRIAADASLDLAVQASAEDISAFLPEYSGSIQLQGTANGNPKNPGIAVSLQGTDLDINGYALRNLQSELDADLIMEGKESGMTINKFSLLLNEAMPLSATGHIGWGDGLSWQAELTGKQLDPSLFLPQWPGKISAAIRSQGKKDADKLVADVRLDRLDGELRSHPLSGSGRAQINGTAVLLDNLHLQLGTADLQVNGSADPTGQFDLTFQADAKKLATFLPDAAGQFHVQGKLSGTREQPDLALDLQASALQFKNYSVNKLDSRIKADLAKNGVIDAEIRINGLRIKEEEISRASLQVQGSTEQHTLHFSADSRRGKAQLTAAGGMQEQQWQGKLTELVLFSRQFGDWKTLRPAELLFSATDCAVTDFTLGHDPLQIALSGTWNQENGWQVDSAEAKDFALSLLKEWDLPVPDLDGMANVSLTAQGKGAIPEQAELTVTLPQLSLTTVNDAEDAEEKSGKTVWRWEDNKITARLRENTAMLQVQTRFQDGSDTDLDVTVKNCGDFSQPEAMPLSGQLNLNIRDLQPFARFSNDAVQANGGLAGTVRFTGTAGSPGLNGEIALTNSADREGEIYLPAAGINLKKISLGLEGNGRSNKVKVQLASGAGILQAEGVVQHLIQQNTDQQWTADFTLSGKDFQAVNLPEYRVVISPDLHLLYGKTGTTLNGTVVLPKATIAPVGFSGAVSSSKDVIVVDEDGTEQQGTSPIFLDLKLVMGKEVALNTFGLKGFLDGSLQINAKPGGPVTGLGSLDLRDATFEFEGNVLQLSRGRVFYQGGPIDDPGLDIQASRETDKIEVGLRLAGKVNDMNMRLYSNTPMEDSEILSYLLTGQDISKSSSGQDAALSPAAATLGKVGGGALLKQVDPLGTLDMENLVDLSIGGGDDASDVSLVMGKEIYKDLYISYGKDLTGAGGTFKARYDLKYGFSVETATNAKTSGADLLWSWEH